MIEGHFELLHELVRSLLRGRGVLPLVLVHRVKYFDRIYSVTEASPENILAFAELSRCFVARGCHICLYSWSAEFCAR